MNEKSDQDLERQLSEMLTDGEMEKKDREKDVAWSQLVQSSKQIDPRGDPAHEGSKDEVQGQEVHEWDCYSLVD